MASVWIVHRDARLRESLARLAGLRDDVRVGAPGDPGFAGARAPRVVVLGLAGDFETELEFAHRVAARLPGTRWIFVAEPADREEAERLFDALAAEFLPFPPPAQRLGARVRAALRARPAERLSERRQRDALSERFSRWFADLELPDLLRALDPRLAGVPLLVRGESGTGRALLAQYVHTFGGSAGGAFAFVPCAETRSATELLETLRAQSDGRPSDRVGLAVCLEDADHLPRAVQKELCRWIEFGPPAGAVRATRLRWMATVGDDREGALAPGLAVELEQALAGVSVRLPPLREREEAVERFVDATARAWCDAHGEEPPELGIDALEALCEHLWPGNLRELEAVVVRSLAAGPRGPLRAEALRFDGIAGDAPFPERAAEPPVRELAPAQPPPRFETPTPILDASFEDLPGAEADLPPEPVAEPVAEPAATEAGDGPPPLEPSAVRRLSGALAHELRNPLVALRTFTELLPERFDDPRFRDRFRSVVGADLDRIERVAERVSHFAGLGGGERSEVDVTELLEGLLEERREEIRSRRLLVLKELEGERPLALGRGETLAFVFEWVLDRFLDWLPDAGTLYLASRHHAADPRGGPSLRVLVRLRRQTGEAAEVGIDAEATLDVSEGRNALELVLAELLVRGEGGSLTVSGDAGETVVVVDLPARPD